MVSLDIGRICIKTAGRESGKYCVVLKKLVYEKTKSDSFVLVAGPKLLTGVKRRRSNIQHLKPTAYTLEVKEDATDEEIISAYDKANLITKFNLKKPSAAELKEAGKPKEEPAKGKNKEESIKSVKPEKEKKSDKKQ